MSTLGYDNVEEFGRPRAPNLNYKAFVKPFQQSQVFIADSSTWLDERLGLPGKRTPDVETHLSNLRNAIELSEYQLNNPDLTLGQNITTTISSLAGMLLDPVSLALGGATAKGVGAASEYLLSKSPTIISALSGGRLGKQFVADYLSEDLVSFGTNRFAKYLPKNLQEALKAPLVGTGLMAGFTLPETFNENYNVDSNTINTTGFIKSIAINGGIGFAFSPIGWLGAHLQGKIFRYTPTITDPKKAKSFIKKALKNKDITEEEAIWYEKYITHPEDKENLLKESFPLLRKDEHPVNAMTGLVELPFVNQEELRKMQTFITDRLAADVNSSYYNAAVDFMGAQIMDRNVQLLRENPGLLNAVKGNIDQLEKLLSQKNELLNKVDGFLGKVIPEQKVSKEVLSQKDLFQMMKKGNLSTSELPFNVPKNIERLIKQENKVKSLEKLLKQSKAKAKPVPTDKFLSNIKKKENALQKEKEKLAYMHEKSHRLLKVDEEIASLEKKFLGKEELPERYNTKRDYYRLHDLANLHPKAAKLLQKLNARSQLEMQEAYKELLKGIVQVAESALQETANPESVINYLKDRLEKASNFRTPSIYSPLEQKITEAKSRVIPSEIIDEKNIDVQFERINADKTIPSTSKEEFNEVYHRLKQFKGSEKALQELTKCVLESGINVGL